jgi:circadian clock protein KaiA
MIETPGLGLPPDRYVVHAAMTVEEGLAWLSDRRHPADCLVLEATMVTEDLRQGLTDHGVLLPVVVLVSPIPLPEMEVINQWLQTWMATYHGAVVTLPVDQLHHLDTTIGQAIEQFLQLSTSGCPLPPVPSPQSLPSPDLLTAQQERLTDKLNARLGYLGVYYKRNPDHFLRNMSQPDRETLLCQLKVDYRKIILGYFANDSTLNQNIDAFVNQAFMADISVSHIVEIHMDLMDEFSKQLKLEGRSEEILLDYRLTLIDVIAHLCEMYRRSIPREP